MMLIGSTEIPVENSKSTESPDMYNSSACPMKRASDLVHEAMLLYICVCVCVGGGGGGGGFQ